MLHTRGSHQWVEQLKFEVTLRGRKTVAFCFSFMTLSWRETFIDLGASVKVPLSSVPTESQESATVVATDKQTNTVLLSSPPAQNVAYFRVTGDSGT